MVSTQMIGHVKVWAAFESCAHKVPYQMQWKGRATIIGRPETLDPFFLALVHVPHSRRGCLSYIRGDVLRLSKQCSFYIMGDA